MKLVFGKRAVMEENRLVQVIYSSQWWEEVNRSSINWQKKLCKVTIYRVWKAVQTKNRFGWIVDRTRRDAE